MHQQSPSAQPKGRATDSPRSGIAVTFLLLAFLSRVLVLLVAILATLLTTVALILTLARRRPAAFAGLLVDVEVALLAVIPAGDPWVGDLRLATAVVLLGLTAVGRLLLLLLVVLLTAEGVEELFYEA